MVKLLFTMARLVRPNLVHGAQMGVGSSCGQVRRPLIRIKFGIAAGTLWYGVPRGAQYSFYHGENEVFAITPTTRNVVNVGGNTNFPSIWLGRLNDGFNNAGPYPTRGTFLFFGGSTNNFVTNTGPVVMYFAHLGSDISRLRLHVEDNSPGNSPVDGFSIMGGSCGSGGCNNLNLSQLF